MSASRSRPSTLLTRRAPTPLPNPPKAPRQGPAKPPFSNVPPLFLSPSAAATKSATPHKRPTPAPHKLSLSASAAAAAPKHKTPVGKHSKSSGASSHTDLLKSSSQQRKHKSSSSSERQRTIARTGAS